MNTDSKIIKFSQNDGELFEVYGVGGQKIRRKIADVRTTKDGQNLELVIVEGPPNARNLQGITPRTYFQPYVGYAVYTRPEDHKISYRNLNKKYNWVGLVSDIFEHLAETYNFTYDLFESRDGTWGYFDQETGQWGGIIRDLLDNVADIKKDRVRVVDYLMPFNTDRMTFTISRETSFNNGYTKAFNTIVAIIPIFGYY